MNELSWARYAQAQLEEVQAYLNDRSTSATVALATAVADAVQRILNFPQSGRMTPEFESERIREVLVQRYRLIYVVLEDRITIIGFWHTSRRLDTRLLVLPESLLEDQEP